MADEVKIDSTRFLRRLQVLNSVLLSRPEMGACLQLAHGKRGEDVQGDRGFVVSLQVRTLYLSWRGLQPPSLLLSQQHWPLGACGLRRLCSPSPSSPTPPTPHHPT